MLGSLLAALQGSNALLQVLDFSVRPPVLLVDIVEELLDAEHVAMIGHRNTPHAVGHRLVYQPGNGSLSVQYGILGMDVQVNKILHTISV